MAADRRERFWPRGRPRSMLGNEAPEGATSNKSAEQTNKRCGAEQQNARSEAYLLGAGGAL